MTAISAFTQMCLGTVLTALLFLVITGLIYEAFREPFWGDGY